jgi:uncharacterized protein YyaL (SSP411 family)
MPNRLASEKSPYLLQHAANPVDWYPWGDEAFEAARREDKPIFLSVGYATCHWCHVMEHESFEDAAIARLLNSRFVPIKVDREERPDVDRVYMLFVQATTGSGGWPMSVWLTPGLQPFYGGTYFPPDGRYGRPGFASVLEEISRAWQENRDGVLQSAARLTARIRGFASAEPGPRAEVPGPEALAAAVREFEASFDNRRGGFGGAPKFPRPAELFFLLREYGRTGHASARDMVLQTLRAMAAGGMRDHIGGGFHRYSVDADWRVPHFEKMLYDQAQLSLAYIEAHQVTGDREYAEVADDTLRYVSREMTDPGGGFYSAEDADSLPPESRSTPGARTSEGAFYLWAADDVDSLLGDRAALARARFGIEAGGNAPFDPHGEFAGKNILYLAAPVAELADAHGLEAPEAERRLAWARQVMYEARAGRPRPLRDDKILTAWNGLMIAAFARGFRVLRNTDHLESARRAASFVRAAMWREASRTLFRRYREGDVAIEAYAEDYACLVWGLLELFQAGGDPAWLEWALELQRRQDELFWDDGAGGWYSTTGADPSVVVRMKDDYDGAEPSATSVSVANLTVLAHLTGDATWRARVERTFQGSAARINGAGRSVPMLLAGLSAWHAGVQQIVIVGAAGDASREALERAAAARYLPFAVVVPITPGEWQRRIGEAAPFAAAMPLRDGGATAYVCRDFACQAPAGDPGELAARLSS